MSSHVAPAQGACEHTIGGTMLITTGRQRDAQRTATTWLHACHRQRSVAALAVLSLTLGLGSHASAQRAFYDTARIIPFSGTECVGAKGRPCTTVRSTRTWIEVDTPAAIELSCPRRQPYVVGWDARHHEHISLIVISAGPGPNGIPQRVRLGARNNANARGMALVALGCSSRPFAGGAFMTSRSSVPSKHPGTRR